MPSIRLIVGLGNPGAEYVRTRHNAGADFVETLALRHNISLAPEKKVAGRLGRGLVFGYDVRLLIPDSYMNNSGRCVALASRYFDIEAASLLIAHDELDILPGSARFKDGGGHGGHNGLRDIIPALGTPNFWRLRIGIGHPGSASLVSRWVLSRAGKNEQTLIDHSIDEAISASKLLLAGDGIKAMTQLHSSDRTQAPADGL